MNLAKLSELLILCLVLSLAKHGLQKTAHQLWILFRLWSVQSTVDIQVIGNHKPIVDIGFVLGISFMGGVTIPCERKRIMEGKSRGGWAYPKIRKMLEISLGTKSTAPFILKSLLSVPPS